MPLSSFPAKQVEMESPNWLELPTDITLNIFQRLSTIEILTSVCQVCPLWWNICKDPVMWRTIRMIKCHNPPNDLAKIFHYAIQRSCGQLKDIDIKCFGTDDLLECIAENGSHLRRLRLVDCSEISDKGLIKAAKQLPLLEELDILFSYFTKESLEVIGQSCPLLKSLKYSIGCNEDDMWFDEVFSFIKTMPQLRHLEIRSDLMITSDGLLAILDECPLLESLNIEECDNLHLTGNAWKRCCEQIKNLRLPDEYFWDDDILLESLSENSNDDSNLDSENDYDLDDSEYGTIRDDDKRGYFYRLLGLLPYPRENSDDSDHSDDDL